MLFPYRTVGSWWARVSVLLVLDPQLFRLCVWYIIGAS